MQEEESSDVAGTAEDGSELPRPTPDEDLTELDLDELIERLPPIEGEHVWDREERKWSLRPEVTEFARRLDERVELSDEEWREVLLRSGAIQVRERWPEGRPFAITLQPPEWLGDEFHILMGPKRRDLRFVEIGGVDPIGNRLGRLYREIGKLTPRF